MDGGLEYQTHFRVLTSHQSASLPTSVPPTSGESGKERGAQKRKYFFGDEKIFQEGAHVMRPCMSPRSGVGEGQADR